MKRFCLTLDLKDDPTLIEEYIRWHQNVWPEIIKSITGAGITNLEIFHSGNRLVMLMETDETFSFERKASMDSNNKKVLEWEELMWKFQQPVAWAKPGEKWVLMNKIFTLHP